MSRLPYRWPEPIDERYIDGGVFYGERAQGTEDGLLFNIEIEFEGELEKGDALKKLQEEFSQYNIYLSEDNPELGCTIKRCNEGWWIIDKRQRRTYLLSRNNEGTHLNVYRAGSRDVALRVIEAWLSPLLQGSTPASHLSRLYVHGPYWVGKTSVILRALERVNEKLPSPIPYRVIHVGEHGKKFSYKRIRASARTLIQEEADEKGVSVTNLFQDFEKASPPHTEEEIQARLEEIGLSSHLRHLVQACLASEGREALNHYLDWIKVVNGMDVSDAPPDRKASGYGQECKPRLIFILYTQKLGKSGAIICREFLNRRIAFIEEGWRVEFSKSSLGGSRRSYRDRPFYQRRPVEIPVLHVWEALNCIRGYSIRMHAREVVLTTTFCDNTAKKILECSGTHPGFLQLLCHGWAERCRDPSSRITLDNWLKNFVEGESFDISDTLARWWESLSGEVRARDSEQLQEDFGLLFRFPEQQWVQPQMLWEGEGSPLSGDSRRREPLEKQIFLPERLPESEGEVSMGNDNRPLEHQDRTRLIAELLKLPDWLGVPGVYSVLRAAGLPSKWINSLLLTSSRQVDATNVISDLEGLGHLEERPKYRALGALVEHMLQKTPHIEGRHFLAHLIDHYELITDLAYLQDLESRYPLLHAPSHSTAVDLGWTTAGPDFDWQCPTDTAELERIWPEVGGPLLEAVFLEKGARISPSVCLIRGRNGKSKGTGFLVAPHLVLTNHHVLASTAEAESAEVCFGFRLDEAGQRQQGQAYAVQEILQQSEARELDYALLRLDGNPVRDLGLVPLKLKNERLREGQRLYIIQHPDGEPQKVVLQGNRITYVSPDHRRVQYLTRTKRGSSGAPAFDQNWDVVALHHSRSPVPCLRATRSIEGNEGIPIKALLGEIKHWIEEGNSEL